MSKENRRKPPENRGFFEKQPVFLKEGGSGSRAHGPQSSSDKTFYYINILFRADFPIKKPGLLQSSRADGACALFRRI